jgi:group I intron endonuclease
MIIYRIVNLINEKVYVGQTIRPLRDRWMQHLRDARNLDYPLYRAMRKHGKENFNIEVVASCSNVDELNLKESELISLYKSDKECFGYNILGGGSNYVMPDEVKNKISKALTGKKFKQHISDEEKSKIARQNGMKAVKNLNGLKKFHKDNPNFTKKQSLLLMQDPLRIENLRIKAKKQFANIEKRNEMSVSKGGKKFTVYSLDGKLLFEGYSQYSCANLLNVSQTSVSNWINGLKKSRKYIINLIKKEEL